LCRPFTGRQSKHCRVGIDCGDVNSGIPGKLQRVIAGTAPQLQDTIQRLERIAAAIFKNGCNFSGIILGGEQGIIISVKERTTVHRTP
jgi:hypothetical protein